MTNHQRKLMAELIITLLETDARLRTIVEARYPTLSRVTSPSLSEDMEALKKLASEWTRNIDDFCREILGITQKRIVYALIREGIHPLDIVTLPVEELRGIRQIGFQAASLIDDAA